MNPNRAIVISCFPGTGKTYLYNNPNALDVLDSDSSNFSWLEEGVRNPEFPANYIKHIKSAMNYDGPQQRIILVSSHAEVRAALRQEGIPHYLVYPDIDCKLEYLQRYHARGSNAAFIKLMNDNWENFINQMKYEQGFNVAPIELKEGQYLVDVIGRVIANNADFTS